MQEETTVTLTDQNGNPQEFKILDILTVEDNEFIVAVSNIDGEDMLFVLQVVEKDGEVTYEVPAPDVCEAVVDIFAEEHEEDE